MPDLQTHSPAMGQKDGEKWTAAVDLQPTIPKSDRLLAAEALVPAARHVSPSVAGHRILVVDDNVDAAEAMAMLLDLSGHDVRSAFSGEAGLEMALSFRPDVVFLDIGLPGMNGYEVAEKLLADPATAATRLIALTGWGTEDDIRKSKVAGFYAHLTKPVDPDAVAALLATLLPAQTAGWPETRQQDC
ncbi:response regulator [Polaromonas sp.]|uniref:response regulator n=1 Tax=Polaromonas sp. TaxID=1869339 RepID=UPI0035699A87